MTQKTEIQTNFNEDFPVKIYKFWECYGTVAHTTF